MALGESPPRLPSGDVVRFVGSLSDLLLRRCVCGIPFLEHTPEAMDECIEAAERLLIVEDEA